MAKIIQLIIRGFVSLSFTCVCCDPLFLRLLLRGSLNILERRYGILICNLLAVNEIIGRVKWGRDEVLVRFFFGFNYLQRAA